MPSPMVKAVIAATALSSASNILSQFLEAYQYQKTTAIFDFGKFLRFVLVTFIDAVPNYKWQQLLENYFPGYNEKAQDKQSVSALDVEKRACDSGLVPNESDGNGGEKKRLNLRNTVIKTIIDCTLGAIFNTVAFFILMGLFKRQPMHQIAFNIRHETVGVIIAGYKIWPAASFISFSCVPVERRIIFLNFVGLGWGIYMSLVATRV